ncbi:hypothetical protein [Spirulina sp. 06S082]|uniref:hypothetical protein n=1 Tax=Spirulina sp. 06S082 TaxID=3110248 RepID=UPI002B210C6A|nr:hypothetical protein [Spirulina sp. 06S082]MEA5469925.1 hypothetical protein [Spirulina sp. 06S082]
MLRLIPLFLVISLGIAGVVVFGYYSLVDWNALQIAYVNFSNIANNSPELTALFSAEAQQNIHRINLFAEGVWVLQSAILAAIGLHGICTSSQRKRN